MSSRRNRKLTSAVFCSAILALYIVAPVSPACAQSGSWNVDANGDWSTTSNWLNGIIADGSGNTANFRINILADRTITLDSSRTIGQLVFDDNTNTEWIVRGPGTLTLATSGTPVINTLTDATVSAVIAGTSGFNKIGDRNLTLSGLSTYSGDTAILNGALVIGANAPAGSAGALGNSTSAVLLGDTTGSNAASLLVKSSFTLGRDIIVRAGTSGTLTIGGADITGTASFTGNLLLNRNVNINSSTYGLVNFSTGVISGSGDIFKTGSGTVAFAGNNTYTGTTTILGGALRAVDGVGLPSSTKLFFDNEGVLESRGTFSRTVGSGIGQVQWLDEGGFAAQGGNLIVQLNGNTSTLVWGSANFIPFGLILGSATADAVVEIQNDIDLAGSPRGIKVLDNDSVTTDRALISGVVSNGRLAKSGPGTLVLSAANTYAGGTSLTGGVLQLSGGNNRLLSTGDISVSFATLDIGSTNQSAGTLELGQSSVVIGTGTITANTYDLKGGTVGVVLAGATGITKTSANTLALNRANTYTGDTLVQDGVLSIGANAPAGAPGALGNATSAVVLGHSIGSSPAYITISGSFTVGRDITVRTGSTGLMVLGGTNTSGSANFTGNILLNRDIRVTASTGGTVVFHTGSISGVGSITKVENGTVALNGVNAYLGSTTISDGALRAIDGVGLPVSTSLILAGGVLESSGTFSRTIGASPGQVRWTTDGGFAAEGSNLAVQLNGGTATVVWGSPNFVAASDVLVFGSATANSVTDFQNSIDLAGATRIVAVNDNPNSITDIAQISGVLFNGGLDKWGRGSLLLSTANTYTGATIVSEGSLQFGANVPVATPGPFGNSADAIILGLTAGNRPAALTAYGAFTMFRDVTVRAGNIGALTLGGTNTSGTAEFTGNILLNQNAQLTAAAGGLVHFHTGIISGVGGPNKSGAGTVILSAANTYSGVTTISAGALRTFDGIGMPAGSNLTLAGGVLETNGTFARAIGTASGQVRWTTGGGGFAAQGAPLAVQLNGGTGTVVWGSANFNPAPLMLGSATADAVVDFQNSIDLGTGTRTINVVDNPVVSTDIAHLSGVISGNSLTKTGAGTLVLSAASIHTGTTRISEGTLRLTGTLSNSAVVVSSGAILDVQNSQVNALGPSVALTVDGSATLAANQSTAALAGSSTGTLNLAPNSTLTVGSGGNFMGGLAGTNVEVVIVGNAIFSGIAKPYSGTTTVSPGAVFVNSSSLANTNVVVSGAPGNLAVFANNGSVVGTTTVNSDGVLRGRGTFGHVIVNSGGVVSPGNSPGTLTDASTAWNTGGSYIWEINRLFQFGGTAGGLTGWDLWHTGDLAVSDAFTVEVHSLASNNSAGALGNWTPNQSYQWLIATASNAAFTDSMGLLNLDTSRFESFNTIAGGNFYLSSSPNGNNLFLNFTAVPEPSSLLLIGVAACSLTCRLRAHGRRKPSELRYNTLL